MIGAVDVRPVLGLRASGFVGHSDDRAWYWSGDALVAVDDPLAARLLSRDPVRLMCFEGVIPRWMKPSRRNLIALVQGSIDPLPYHVVIDLDQETYSEAVQFTPSDASDVVVLGTGAVRMALVESLVAYTLSGNVVFEAIFVGRNGSPSDRVVLEMDSSLAVSGGIQGFLRSNSDDLWAGLLADDTLLLLDDRSGYVTSLDNITPVGVQAWDGNLFLTGLADGLPVIAEIDDDGDLGAVGSWRTAIETKAELDSGIRVRDEHDPTGRQLGRCGDRHWCVAIAFIPPSRHVHRAKHGVVGGGTGL